MKNTIKHMKYLGNKRIMIYLLLIGVFFLIACGKDDGYGNTESTSVLDSQTVHDDNGESMPDEKELSVMKPYTYEVEKAAFSFYVSENEIYHIPYVQISGCPDKKLQWKINHTLWKEACWILDCAEIGDVLYKLFSGENTMEIAGVYQYKQYLSVLYEGVEESRLPGKIGYAIVVDTLNGNRILLGDIIKDEEKFQDMLVHYFDDDHREIRLFIFEEDAEKMMAYGRLTEKETVIRNVTFDGENPERDNGEIDSISYLFESTSFYMSEEGVVVLPGARYYEPLVFEWEKISEILMDEFVEQDILDSIHIP